MENHKKFNKDVNKELENFKTKDEKIAFCKGAIWLNIWIENKQVVKGRKRK